MYYAHISEDNRKQTVYDHLNGVAEAAEENAVEMFKPIAHAAGKAHDIGKYAKAFQDRLSGSAVRYEHSICGAAEYAASPYARSKSTAIPAYMLQYCIAGHHTGLPDGGTKNDTDTTLQGRLRHMEAPVGDRDYSVYRTQAELEFPECKEITAAVLSDKKNCIETFAFFTRYLFPA
ncbi:MAG: CRISPR-associated endonuclease Cas3'' [Ruminococcus sp.]|nr:CRISPR-associated endonuclease Cas3'' [Ruminococcus sp.]